MENLPTNNPENINQEPSDADILASMPSFEEMRRQNAVPEGVRDEQDYREYQAEQLARSAEQDKADAEFIEHSNRYITEIEKIENPQDKYMAIASLRYMTDTKRNRSRQSKTEHAQDIMLDFFKRDNKDVTFKEFIKNKKNALRNDGVDEDIVERYDVSYEFGDYLEDIQKGSKIQAINDTEETEEFLEDFNDRVRRGAVDSDLVDFGEWDHAKKRPDSDRGIIVSMADELGDECWRLSNIEYNFDNDRVAKDRARDYRDFAIDKLIYLSNYYTHGESFDHQVNQIKESFYREVTECMENRSSVDYSEGVDYYSAMNMMAVMQIKDEFDEQKKEYERFQEKLAEGQQIIDNFKNSQQ